MSLKWLLIACLIVIVDQLSKIFVINRLGRGFELKTKSSPVIRPIGNRLIGFGLVRQRRTLVLLWSIAVLGNTLLIDRFIPLQGLTAQIGLGAALGGATGNLVDMLWHGAVIDFIDLRIWPVFNVADVAIVMGVAIALWSVFVVG